MTMRMLTILQIIEMFVCYVLVFVGLPAMAFGVKLKKYALSFRMMAYLVIGNFFVINLVLYLQLLHISNRFTLILGTVVAYFFMYLRTHRIDFRDWIRARFDSFEKMTQGTLGGKTMRRKMRLFAWEHLKTGAKWFLDIVIKHIVEWIVFIGAMAVIFYLFGSNSLVNFGYGASDIPVHNWWINGLSKGQLFIDGIYPFGYHCAIYYVHRVFNIDTYVLLRLWGLINIYGVSTALLGFLATVCKRHPFIPFIGLFLYIMPPFLDTNLWARFYSALPQEYGMIFILPSIAFILKFFEVRAEEIKTKKEEAEKISRGGKEATSWAEIEAADEPYDNDEEPPLGEEVTVLPTVEAIETEAKRPKSKSELKAELKIQRAAASSAKKAEKAAARDAEKERKAALKRMTPEERMRLKVKDERKARAALNIPSAEERMKAKILAERTGKKLPKESTKETFKEALEEIAEDFIAEPDYDKADEHDAYDTSTVEASSKVESDIEVKPEPAPAAELSAEQQAIIKSLSGEGEDEIPDGPTKLEKALLFVRDWREKIADYIHTRVPSQWIMLLFSMSLSLTVAVHFYPAIVALLLCLGVGLGCAVRLFRKQYFFSVIKGGLLSGAFAVLPMLIAFIFGTPLQGSMNWALGVINGESGDVLYVDLSTASEMELREYRASMEALGFTLNEDYLVVDENGNVIDGSDLGEYMAPVEKSFGQKVMEKIGGIFREVKYLPETAGYYTDEFLVARNEDGTPLLKDFHLIIFLAVGVCLLCGLISLWKMRDYGFALLSVAFGTVFLVLLLCSGSIGLPQLMDPARTRLFLIYLVAVLFTLAIDGALSVVGGWVKLNAFQWLMSFVVTGAFLYEAYALGMIREPEYLESMEYNGAIRCTTNILAENDDKSFTILSANDEFRMVEERGYHYEVIRLLKHMVLYDTQEYSDVSLDRLEKTKASDVYIPTPKIYIYIEKVPKDYFTPYYGSGQRISLEGAKKRCPRTNAITCYMGEDRWICMSKMHYWALEYMKLIPDDMYVYYEDDDFICYCIEQNDYSLYNLSIDYGYNYCGEENLEDYYDANDDQS